MYFPGKAQQILQQNQGKHILNSDIVSHTLQLPELVDESYVRNEIFMSINFGNFSKFTKFKNLTIQIVVSAYKKDDSGYHLCKVIIQILISMCMKYCGIFLSQSLRQNITQISLRSSPKLFK